MPRWMHRAWARIGGYFWLPCPECGRMFGGHEVRGPAYSGPERISLDGKPRKILCPICTPIAACRSISREYS